MSFLKPLLWKTKPLPLLLCKDLFTLADTESDAQSYQSTPIFEIFGLKVDLSKTHVSPNVI